MLWRAIATGWLRFADGHEVPISQQDWREMVKFVYGQMEPVKALMHLEHDFDDWRKEAEAEGIDASAIFERMVAAAGAELAATGGSGSVPGSTPPGSEPGNVA